MVGELYTACCHRTVVALRTLVAWEVVPWGGVARGDVTAPPFVHALV